jgi:Protein of unknown function (DUF2817)
MRDVVQSFFAGTYLEARAKFLAASEPVVRLREHHPLPAEVGPDGQPLFLDLAWVGPPDADVVLLSLSGTHGSEGFCGSAAQTAWLYQRPALPPGVAQLFVHAVNPFGYAHMVRSNENNVDLNRNFIDFDAPLPVNPLYEEFHATLPTRIGFDDALVDEWESAYETFWAKHGAWAASDAVTRGQFTRPDGVHFGGTGPQWSARILRSILRNYCAKARHVVYIDWHTLMRLGDGKLVFLCFNQTGDALFERVGSWWTRAAIDRDRVNRQWGEGIERSERRPSRHGLLMWGLQNELAPRADLAGAVIEFSADAGLTEGDLRAQVREKVYERWLLATRAYDTPVGRRLVEWLREANSPTRVAFQETAIEAALGTYRAALDGAGRWAAEKLAANPGLLVRSAGFV